MRRATDLESRLKAILRPDARRQRATLPLVAGVCAIALLVVTPLASLQAPSPSSGAIAGVVRDASGAVVPGARVTVALMGAHRKEFAVTNAAGQFMLRPLPEGTYSVSVAQPGFALFRTEGIQVKAGATAEVQVVLNIGQIVERLEVRGEAAPTPGGAPGQAMPVGVGGNVQRPKLVHMVKPTYPPDCKLEGVQGTVALRAVIGRDGAIQSLEQINELVDARLVAAAKEAVQQWRYQPPLLNGQPVEVVTEIEVNFTLTQ